MIDHIKAGEALRVFQILGITGKEGEIVSVAMNVPSSKIDKKDVVKVANRFLKSEETDKLRTRRTAGNCELHTKLQSIGETKSRASFTFQGTFKVSESNMCFQHATRTDRLDD